MFDITKCCLKFSSVMTVKFIAIRMSEVLCVPRNTRHAVAVINCARIVEETFKQDEADGRLISLL